MFNLDQAITEWRRRMAAGGIKAESVLDELESHLREDVEGQMRPGMNQEQAFEAAACRIGQSNLLKTEFAKVGGFVEARAGKLIGIALCVMAAAISLIAIPGFIAIHEMRIGQRLLGLAAIAATLFAIASWRFNYNYLPVIRNRRLRMAAGLACGLGGVLWLCSFGGILFYIIVPRVLGRVPTESGENFFPVFAIGISFLWAIAFAAVLGSIAYGLEEAARRQHQKEIHV